MVANAAIKKQKTIYNLFLKSFYIIYKKEYKLNDIIKI